MKHIIKIEKELGVTDIFDEVKVPSPISLRNFFSLKSNTPLFLLRAHIILFAFGVTYLFFRLLISK
mgnify:CR=1 FL=1